MIHIEVGQDMMDEDEGVEVAAYDDEDTDEEDDVLMGLPTVGEQMNAMMGGNARGFTGNAPVGEVHRNPYSCLPLLSAKLQRYDHLMHELNE